MNPASAFKLGTIGQIVAYLAIRFAESQKARPKKPVSICDSTKNHKFNNLLTAPIAPWHAA
jgi:hypothetical protein